MPTVHLEVDLSPDMLLQAASQLPQEELAHLVDQLLLLRAQRSAPCLTQEETELLLAISAGIPAETRARWDYLLRKRDAELLTEQDHAELLRLTETIEHRQAERVAWLIRLAQIRETSLNQLMADLNIPGCSDS